MRLLDSQLDKPSLSNLGREACQLLIARDFRRLAVTFGYALAYNRDIAAAIETDFERCLSGHCTQDFTVDSVTVKYFQPNDTGLLAVVECVLAVGSDARVLVELVAGKNGENKSLYLEDMNAMA